MCIQELQTNGAGQRQETRLERARASARGSKEEMDALFPAVAFRPQLGSCPEPPPQGALRGSALPSRRRTPSSRGLLLCQRPRAESDPLIEVGPRSSANARSRRYVPSRNSILREATSARDKPRAFLYRDTSRPDPPRPWLPARLATAGAPIITTSAP